MYTYEMTKLRGIQTINDGVMAYIVCDDYEKKMKLLESIKSAVDMMMCLEEHNAAYKRGDLAGMCETMRKYGF